MSSEMQHFELPNICAESRSMDQHTNLKKEVKKVTKLGMSVKKDDNFGEWYSEVVVKSGMIEYYDVSGCYVLRPWSYAMWEILKDFFDKELKKLGVENAYFPLFVSEPALTKEKNHIEGFAPEVAWVTRSGSKELDSPIAIRPTSETVMYPIFAKWIRGHRDLPLRLNQWCNVVRCEKNPSPFIRSFEFLWQEGHTAFATQVEADEEVKLVLELYRRLHEELLAVPVIKGRKSELEKFAGGLYTTSIEAFIPNTGRGIQGATSHCLGQNFSSMFDIYFEDANGVRSLVWQNSWGFSTRVIGAMVMVHGDDKGLVLPPRVAPVQVVVIPIPFQNVDYSLLLDACHEVCRNLESSGIRVKEDTRDNHLPAWKFSDWELKGVPLRIEIGPRDLEAKQVRMARRDNGAKEDVPLEDVATRALHLLNEMQDDLFKKAKEERDACLKTALTWDDFIEALNDKKMVLAPWCDEVEVEKDVKLRTKGGGGRGAAKTLCMPFEQPELSEGQVCFASGKPAKKWALWGRSY